MKVSLISNTNAKIQSFKGTTEIYYGAKPYLSGNEKYYPNSSIEKTLDTFHLNRTGKIYFADPMEQVSEKQKKEVDYVVYDNEPSYPNINEEVKKTYLTKTDENYRSRFEQIRDYFYRREMGGFANTDDAKKEQWKAAECIRIFDKSADLRKQRQQIEEQINDAQARIKQSKNSLELTTETLNDVNIKLEKTNDAINNLTAKQNLYKQLDAETNKNYKWNSLKEKSMIKNKLAETEIQLEIENREKDRLDVTKSNLLIRKKILNDKLNNYQNAINANTPKLDYLRFELNKMFDELKDFYNKENI